MERYFDSKKTIGGFPLPLSSDSKVAYTDSLLLKLVHFFYNHDVECG